jgi:4-hydroxy-tetrahydrodipicolinate synthase
MEATMRDLSIVVPIVTPCTRAGEVDLDGLRCICDDMLRAGCGGIFLAGSTGRGPWFSRRDRARACRALADMIPGQASLLAGCMASGLPDMLDNIHAMADAGAQVAVVTAPGYFAYNHQEIETIFFELADVSPLPLMLYDIPGFARVKLNGHMVVRLARQGNIIGLKDSTADFDRFKGLVLALSDLPAFYLLQGKERVLADSLFLGASGFVVSMVHIDPRPFAALREAARTGNQEAAGRIQAEIVRLMDLFEEGIARRPETSTFFHFLNWILHQRGLCQNILLDHDGDCPQWVAEMARQALEICRSAASIQV